MKLIVLYGKPNTGKTTTLEIVYERLKRINVQNTNMFWYLDDIQRDFIDVLVIDKTRLGEKGSNSSKLNLTQKSKTVKIGIVTQGDYVTGNKSMNNHLQTLLDEDCFIAICPCSEKDNQETTPRNQIDDFVEKHQEVTIVNEFSIKKYSEEIHIANNILKEVKNNC
ncbi:MAG: hypothetical protein II937_17515 [Bacteroidales bacterium]|nr:hypothetical protein [Bacteroidales bacterium]